MPQARPLIMARPALASASANASASRQPCGVPLRLELRDSPPEDVPGDMPAEPYRFDLPAGARQAAVYHLTPQARGDTDELDERCDVSP